MPGVAGGKQTTNEELSPAEDMQIRKSLLLVWKLDQHQEPESGDNDRKPARPAAAAAEPAAPRRSMYLTFLTPKDCEVVACSLVVLCAAGSYYALFFPIFFPHRRN